MSACPTCGGASSVVDSRASGSTVRRRRRCDACGARWATIEVGLEHYRALAAAERTVREAVRGLEAALGPARTVDAILGVEVEADGA